MTRKSKWLGLWGWAVVLALGLPLARLALGESLSDKAVAEQILAGLPTATPATSGSSPAPAPSGSSRSASLVRSPVEEAKRALDRAAGARSSGDVRHAELLEGLGREWAEAARDLLRAAAAESDAGALETAAVDAGVRAERARALLEESIARRGRAEAELDKLTADGGLFPIQRAPASSTKGKPNKGAP